MLELEFNCPENVGGMEQTTNGRFCNTCQKNIVDFSEMTNEQIRKELGRKSDKTCGIVKGSQVRNNFRSKISSRFRIAFFSVFILGMSASDLYGQDSLTVVQDSVQINKEIESGFIIHGSIKYEDSLALPFARIWVEVDSAAGIKERVVAISDFDGNYRIVLPQSPNGPFSVTAQSVGFHAHRIDQISFEPNLHQIEVDIKLTVEHEIELIGIINICPPLISNDPYEIGKTVLDGDDMRGW